MFDRSIGMKQEEVNTHKSISENPIELHGRLGSARKFQMAKGIISIFGCR